MADEESDQRKAHVSLDKAYTAALEIDKANKRQEQRTSINRRSPTKQRRVNVAWRTRVITVVKDDTLGEICQFFAAVLFPAATRQSIMTGRTERPDTSQIKLQALSDHLKNEAGWTAGYVWFQDGDTTYVVNSDERLQRTIELHNQKRRSIELQWAAGDPREEEQANGIPATLG